MTVHAVQTPGAHPLGPLSIQRGDAVLVVGGYGAGNVGDDAILAGLLSQVPAGARVTVVSRDPGETARLHGVRAVGPFGALWAMVRCDVVIVGGGGMFSAHMGPFARQIPIFGLAARFMGKRVGFHGVGIYGSTPPWVRRTLRWLMPRLSLLTVRDSVSADVVMAWGFTATETADLSTFLQPAPDERAAEIMAGLGLDPDRPVIGLALTATEPYIADRLLALMPQVIRDMPEVQFCYVPMSHHPTVPRHNDLPLGRSLQNAEPRLAVLEQRLHPGEVLSLFRRFSAALCMRYHSLLFAKRAGVPVVPISYAEKTDSWIRDHGLLPAPMDAEGMTRRLREALADAGVRHSDRERVL